MSEIEKLEIENMKELFSVLEKNKSFKSIELDKIQCGQVYEFVTAQQSKIEELEESKKVIVEDLLEDSWVMLSSMKHSKSAIDQHTAKQYEEKFERLATEYKLFGRG